MRNLDYEQAIAGAAAHAQRANVANDDRFATFAAHLAGGLSFHLGEDHPTVRALSDIRRIPRQSDLTGEQA